MTTGTVKTACPYCGVGCGVVVTRGIDGGVAVSGDPAHPANLGRLCSKGSALAETLSLDDRLLYPAIDGVRASWSAALDRVARTFVDTIAAHGPESVAFYVSGQLLTEDYYVANKLMKGFIGSANIDTNSRLCMASSVAGHRRAFGSDTVPGIYEDFEQADLVVLVGSNLAWCHPVLYQRLAAAREKRGTKVIVVDPRRTATCELADLHLPLAPGSDVALFNGLLAFIVEAGAVDETYINRHTVDLAAAVAAARSSSVAYVAETTGLDTTDILAFYRLFAETPRVVTAYSQGVNQATAGTDKVNAIINCHFATGRIGKPGMGPFSLTGQPNAMGGREVGGLANMLAAHMEIDNAAHRKTVQTFWRSPRIASKPGLKAVDLFRGVKDGSIKALWIMATNPVVSMPEANAVRDAIQACPFVVVSDVVDRTDTTAHGHVLLPSTAWGEKDGTVTNSERRISRQRAFLPPPGEARPDWWQLAEVGRRMGFAEAFSFRGPHEIFAEHAALSGVENGGSRDFDISRFADIDADSYEAMEPFQWPQPARSDAPKERFFADGQFYTPTRRGRFVATPFRPLLTAVDAEFPLVLNTGRIRDQWHTMTRTGKAARLSTHIAEPVLEIHPADADRYQLTDNTLCVVASAHGRAILRVSISDLQRRGSVFAPIHWTDQMTSHARIDAVVRADVDPVSGQPGLKQTPVSVAPFPAVWYGLLTSRDRPDLSSVDHWVLVRVAGGWRAEIAGTAVLDDPAATLRSWLGRTQNDDIVHYDDAARATCSLAVFEGEQLMATAFLGPTPLAVARAWTAEQLYATFPTGTARLHALAGHPGDGGNDRGPIVCSCFGIGRNEIAEFQASAQGVTVESVGQHLKAGTNCGSCRPEIAKLLRAGVPPVANEIVGSRGR